MQDRINLNIVLDSDNISLENIKEWFSLTNYFTPLYMSCKLTKNKLQKCNIDKFYNNIKNELEDNKFNLIIKDDINTVSVYKNSINENISSLFCILSYEIYEKNKISLLSIMDKFMINYDGIVSYACSLDDMFWQNNEDLNIYEIRKKSINNLRTKDSEIFPGKKIVDIEFNPGHSHRVNGLWFGSCWMMWFGNEYFKYIPKDTLRSFNNYFEIRELESNCLRVTLYESPWDYEELENREKQKSFRTQVGIDKIAQILVKDPKEKSINPSIEIRTGNFTHGGIRLINYYFDEYGEIVSKSNAKEVLTHELDDNGRIVWSENIKIKDNG